MVVIGGDRIALGRADRRGRLHLPRPPPRPISPARSAVSSLPSVLRVPLRAADVRPRAALHPASSTSLRAASRGSGASAAARRRSRRRCEDRVGVAGRRRARAADSRARLHARRAGGRCASGSRRRYRVISFDNRGIGESEIPPGPYTRRGARRRRRAACSTRPGSSAHTCSGRASAASSPRWSPRSGPTGSSGSCSRAPRRAGRTRIRCPSRPCG